MIIIDRVIPEWPKFILFEINNVARLDCKLNPEEQRVFNRITKHRGLNNIVQSEGTTTFNK
jgi:hypothetical protein